MVKTEKPLCLCRVIPGSIFVNVDNTHTINLTGYPRHINCQRSDDFELMILKSWRFGGDSHALLHASCKISMTENILKRNDLFEGFLGLDCLFLSDRWMGARK